MYYKYTDVNNREWTVYGETAEVADRNYKKMARIKYKLREKLEGFGRLK